MNNCELRIAEGKGQGLYASRSFQKGQLIMKCEVQNDNIVNDSHASQVGMNRWMLFKGVGQKINHSCDPNCGIQCDEDLIHKYVACKEIEKDDELTYDYAMGNYEVNSFPDCQCGANNCRKVIKGYKNLGEERKKDYEGFIAPYLVENDKKHEGQK